MGAKIGRSSFLQFFLTASNSPCYDRDIWRLLLFAVLSAASAPTPGYT